MAMACWGLPCREIPVEGATEDRAAIAGQTIPMDILLLEAEALMEAEVRMEAAVWEREADLSADTGPTGAAAADLGEYA